MLFPPLALSDYFHLLLVCVGVSLTSVLSLVTVFSMRLTKLQLIKNKLKCTHVKLISGLTHVFCFVFFFKLYYLQIGSFQRYWLLIASTTADINFCQIAWLWGLRADLSLHAIVIVIQFANSCGKKEKTPWKLYKCKTSRIFSCGFEEKCCLPWSYQGPLRVSENATGSDQHTSVSCCPCCSLLCPEPSAPSFHEPPLCRFSK